MEEKIADQTADYMMMIPENCFFGISSSSCVEQREADDYYAKECPLGFIDTLNAQHFNTLSSSLFDDLLQNNHHLPSIPVMFDDDHQPPPLNDTVNTPLTPNSSSSVSSLSDETAAADHDGHRKKRTVFVEEDAAEEEQDQEMTKKELKPKKKNQKKQKQPRFAFMTKTEIDNLDDGYRWRKYGQKAVKNSPFPRSYYRCTTTACGVKKRVERSREDPTTVVTTYEGTHTHPCPITPRGTTFGFFPPSGGGGGLLSQFMTPKMMFYHHQKIHDEQAMINQLEKQHHHQSYLHNLATCSPTSNLNVRSISSRNPTLFDRGGISLCPSASNSLVITADNNGLLQDMLPSQILLKEPKEE